MEWYDLGLYLDVPSSIRSEIKDKYSDDAQRKQGMLDEWRNRHPAPSWMLVANVLYSSPIGAEIGKYLNLLQVVKGKYLKGEILLHMFHCVIGVCHTRTNCPGLPSSVLRCPTDPFIPWFPGLGLGPKLT